MRAATFIGQVRCDHDRWLRADQVIGDSVRYTVVAAWIGGRLVDPGTTGAMSAKAFGRLFVDDAPKVSAGWRSR